MRRYVADEKYDYLIVGAGLYGAYFAYLARKHGNLRYLFEYGTLKGIDATYPDRFYFEDADSSAIIHDFSNFRL